MAQPAQTPIKPDVRSTLTVGEIRASVAKLPEGERWQVAPELIDSEPAPSYHSGADTSSIPLASTIARVGLKEVFSPDLSPQLLNAPARTALLSFLDKFGSLDVTGIHTDDVPVKPGTGPSPIKPGPGLQWSEPYPKSVGWRNRYGRNFLCTIQNQGGCESCWAFATAALVETMVNIEHDMWAKRTEGDIRDGWGGEFGENWAVNGHITPCQKFASTDGPLDWVVKNGVCDPDCYAWVGNDQNYDPTVDRVGRIVRVGSWKWIGNVKDQKVWLDTVGPIVSPDALKKGPDGNHEVLIVGYNEDQGCWICRNSWTTNFGDDGYFRIAYGQLRGSPSIQHIFRDNDSGNGWKFVNTISPTKSVGMPALTSSTYNRNFEIVFWEAAGEGDQNSIHYWYYQQSSGKWIDGGIFASGSVAGYPAIIQSTFNLNREGFQPGILEVIFRATDNTLHHWRGELATYNPTPTFNWTFITAFSKNILQSGPSLVQGLVGTPGHFYYVTVLTSGAMQLFWRNNVDSPKDTPWIEGEIFGAGIGSTPPCLIQGNYGTSSEKTPGNFELCVARDGVIQHWWRDNSDITTVQPVAGQVPSGKTNKWSNSATFGANVKHVWSLIESSYGYNLEVIAELNSGALQHFWRDGSGWHIGPVINV